MTKPANDLHFGATDLHLFAEGTHARLYDKLGAHPITQGKVRGTWFAVWAPNAARVGVVGDFNGWREPTALAAREGGLWEGLVEGVGPNALYKYRIESRLDGYRVDKCDPLAFACEVPPATSARVVDLDYAWGDDAWVKSAAERRGLGSPMSIYELHLGSWRRVPEQGNRSLTYREMALQLAAYVQQMGFTHVEIMPVAEHPFYGSWGYQVTGFFAPTARYGTPQDFMFLVDTLHQHGIGVILDWTPAHFPTDEHGLVYFDGTHLYEHADPRQGIHPDWGSAIFNYGRNEVRSFLISNACFWLDRYHVDGLRVDAVASMLYLDYARKHGEWVPNRYGGRENIEAIDFLRLCNQAVYRHFPDAQTIAEESTAWPMVSRPTYTGGLGFGYKWDMGWMHDTLSYFQQDPVHRPYHHRSLTFRGLYAFSENFVLPLSHDEVVHGKGSLIGKMHGDEWQRFANLRLLYCYQWAQPGKKLLFMGGEWGQWHEWNHEASLDWHLLEQGPYHRGVSLLVGELNRLYRQERSLHAGDADPTGLSWIDANDVNHSVLAFLRRSGAAEDDILCVFNFTPVPRYNYRLGVDVEGYWQELLNSDAGAFGGSGQGNQGGVEAAPYPSHGRPFSLVLTLPPLSALFLRLVSPAGHSR